MSILVRVCVVMFGAMMLSACTTPIKEDSDPPDGRVNRHGFNGGFNS